jgi:hypothetical protein
MQRLRVRWVGVGVIAVLGLGGSSVERDVHRDMAGPLAVGGGGTVSLDRPEDLLPGHAWSGTHGSFLPCVAQGGGPIEITTVEWSSEPGLEPVSVVAVVRTFDSTTDMPIGSASGTATDWERDSIGSLRVRDGVEGYVVEIPCHDDLGIDGAATDEIVFILTADERGGHIGDVTFRYLTPDGSEHAVVTDSDFYLCGSAVPDEYDCP